MRKRQSTTHIREYDSESDEESVEGATHPQESSSVSFPHTTLRDDCFSVIEQLKQCRVCWVQILTIYIAAVLTYSYNNSGDHNANVQIAIMTVITLVGASPIESTYLIPTAIGAFVGGQNIIGSTGLMEDNNGIPASNYLWLMLLSIVVGLVWYFIINNPRLKILDGYAGRLGSTTFLGMNLTMLIFCSVGVANWNRYYYGIIHAIHIAEEDTSTTLATDIWIWSEEIELAIGYVLSVLWLGVSAGTIRIMHNNYVQRCKVDAISTPPVQLNNVSFPVLWALLCMLVVNATQYKHASGLFNGFAVGAYVAMASLQKISSVSQFLVVSSLAAMWGLALTPFFVGFAGSKCISLYTYFTAMDLISHLVLFSRYTQESGFTSMLGHVTYNILDLIVRRVRSARLRSIQEEQLALDSSSLTRDNVLEEAPPPSHQHHHKPKQKAFYTKQQRRQQKKLKHLHDEEENNTPKLHHRAWSALPVEGDSEWKYSPSLESQQELNNVV